MWSGSEFKKFGSKDRATALAAHQSLGEALGSLGISDEAGRAERDFWVQFLKSSAAFLEQSWRVDPEKLENETRHQVAAVQAGRAAGRQVHLLSVRAQLGMRDRGYSAYCATKGALVMLIKQHAVELSAHGICVNGVAPTVVRGEMARHWLENPQTRQQVLQRIPLGRVAEPVDVVGATLFFCSPAAAFVTGQVLYVDGGLTATQ